MMPFWISLILHWSSVGGKDLHLPDGWLDQLFLQVAIGAGSRTAMESSDGGSTPIAQLSFHGGHGHGTAFVVKIVLVVLVALFAFSAFFTLSLLRLRRRLIGLRRLQRTSFRSSSSCFFLAATVSTVSPDLQGGDGIVGHAAIFSRIGRFKVDNVAQQDATLRRVRRARP